MASGKEKSHKGSFSPAALGLSKSYLFPDRRRAMVLLGLLMVVGFALYFAPGTSIRGSDFLSGGPLSSHHAALVDDCAACHQAFQSAADQQCLFCHQPSQREPATYSFEAHYVYRSRDAGRSEMGRQEHGHQEMDCAECHPEHRGRFASVVDVPDSKCTNCHEYGSFNHGHPEFAGQNPDQAGLRFTHIRHTESVYQFLVDRGESPLLEKTCLFCHQPEPGGKNFAPIDFERHCGDCHLGEGFETPSLDVADAGKDRPGVASLATIRQSKKPGTGWAFAISPDEFQFKRGGAKIVKSPVHHLDPWILYNLRNIRGTLFPEPELASLLNTVASTGARDVEAVYIEAIRALEEQAAQLRARPEPEIRRDLLNIENTLKQVRDRLARRANPPPGEVFVIDPNQPNPNLSEEQMAAWVTLSTDLTSLCTPCHPIEKALIPRVQKDQRIYRRAEFDHRAHVLVKGCLDCHDAIPLTEEMSGGREVPASADAAEIQNLPAIDNCRDCHHAREAANTCVTCHHFHPDKSRFNDLQPFVD